MKKVLIAARTADACRILAGHISGGYDVTTATDGMTVRGIDISVYSFIFVSVPLENESGLELITELRERTAAHLIAIVREEAADAAFRRLAPVGAYIITKPVFKGSLMQAIRFCEMHADSEVGFRQRIAELERQSENDRLISRATLIIMGREQLDEDTAHHRLQKLAMDLRKPASEIARDIIDGLLL